MSEFFNGHKVFSLLEFAQSIERAIQSTYTKGYWISAELAKLNYYPSTGHAYPSLVQKNGSKIEAQISAMIWKNDYQKINEKFLNDIQEPLKDGTKILLFGKLKFTPGHGLRIIIEDVDTTYTRGDLENEKQKSIQKLREEGIFHYNQKLTIPLIPKRIAVISVRTGDGYRDFMNQLDNNSYGYQYFTMLFESRVEGNLMVSEMLSQFKQIKKAAQHFDIVIIIRGGGGDIGLSVFNNYELAAEIAKFPIPVFTGIGHASHHHVVDMVAAKSFINPTELAGFLIQRYKDFENQVDMIQQRFVKLSQQSLNAFRRELELLGNVLNIKSDSYIQAHKSSLSILEYQVRQQSKHKIEFNKLQLNHMGDKTGRKAHEQIKAQRQWVLQFQRNLKENSMKLVQDDRKEIAQIEKQVSILDPQNVLKRGYSITTIHNQSITDPKKVKKGDVVKTILYNGQLESVVIK